jgi:hypothetical protein
MDMEAMDLLIKKLKLKLFHNTPLRRFGGEKV